MIRIPTRTHSIMDLLFSASLLAAPFILHALSDDNGRGRSKKRRKKNNKNGIEDILLPAMGAGVLAQGLVSNHELGAVKVLSMTTHLTMDIGRGAFMIAAPWLLNLDERLKTPMVALGVAEIVLALLTEPESTYEELESVLNDPDAFIEEISHVL
ncbi:MAG: hypothetical protein ACXWEY_06920 [Bacteroidia bacterium]